MKIKFHGELSIPELKQAIFELLQELEDEYLVRHSKNISLHLTPTDGTGDRTYCNNRYGKKIDTIKCYGPYRSITEKYESWFTERHIMPKPYYLDLKQARETLSELGIEFNERQMKRSAEKDAHGRRKLPFFVDPIDKNVKYHPKLTHIVI